MALVCFSSAGHGLLYSSLKKMILFFLVSCYLMFIGFWSKDSWWPQDDMQVGGVDFVVGRRQPVRGLVTEYPNLLSTVQWGTLYKGIKSTHESILSFIHKFHVTSRQVHSNQVWVIKSSCKRMTAENRIFCQVETIPCKSPCDLNFGRYRRSKFQNPPFYLHFFG